MSKRILILGGSYFQIPAIKYARSAGYHVITCDYRPDNPGHKYAHEYYNVSTTDMEGVRTLANQIHVDGILAYASEPAAPTAAYVGNRLGMFSNPYESVSTLTNKDLYRSFLRKHGFNAPRARTVDRGSRSLPEPSELSLPLMVKPVDSSGSKGVSKVAAREEMSAAIEHAMCFSRVARVIIEEYISREGPQIGGEAFVLNGKLVFMCLGDQFIDSLCNPYVPAGMLFPSVVSDDICTKIASDLQRLVDLLPLSFGGLNLEIMVGKNGRPYLMEVAPRTGGNFLPEMMRYCAGADIARYCVESALGHDLPELHRMYSGVRCDGFFAYYAIHSRGGGRLRSIHFSDHLRSRILESHIFKLPGDTIEVFNNASCGIGILLLRFDTREQMQHTMDNMMDHVLVELIGNDHESEE